MPGIHVLAARYDVDGRDKPGHDVDVSIQVGNALSAPPILIARRRGVMATLATSINRLSTFSMGPLRLVQARKEWPADYWATNQGHGLFLPGKYHGSGIGPVGLVMSLMPIALDGRCVGGLM